MIRRSGPALAAAALVCLSAETSAAAQRLPVPRAIDDGADLTWVVKLDMLQIGKVVADHGVHKGYAVVECTLTAGGRPKACVVTDEEGGGFGKLVIELAGRYQAASKDKAGQPVLGRKVRFAFAVGGMKEL